MAAKLPCIVWVWVKFTNSCAADSVAICSCLILCYIFGAYPKRYVCHCRQPGRLNVLQKPSSCICENKSRHLFCLFEKYARMSQVESGIGKCTLGNLHSQCSNLHPDEEALVWREGRVYRIHQHAFLWCLMAQENASISFHLLFCRYIKTFIAPLQDCYKVNRITIE